MPTQIMPPRSGYGLFNCDHCAGKAEEAARIIREATSLDVERLADLAEWECGDHCGFEWADELPPLDLGEPWPTCKCCGRPAQLLTPLVSIP